MWTNEIKESQVGNETLEKNTCKLQYQKNFFFAELHVSAFFWTSSN